jgi:ABC-2 type transport system ATP-binding protein
MTVTAYLSFMFDLKQLSLPKKAHIAEICESVGIGPVKKRIIKNLSKGFQQRVGLAQAMLGNPGLLIMDEPTVGLDPIQILEIRSLIREIGKNSAVIFSSHVLQEVQAVCDRVIIINDGVLIANDTLENLSRLEDNRLFLSVEGSGEELLPAIQSLQSLKSVKLLDHAEEQGAADFELESENGRDPRRELFRLLAKKDRPILALRRSGVSLEDAFVRLTAGDTAALAVIAASSGARLESELGAAGEAPETGAPDGAGNDSEAGVAEATEGTEGEATGAEAQPDTNEGDAQ